MSSLPHFPRPSPAYSTTTDLGQLSVQAVRVIATDVRNAGAAKREVERHVDLLEQLSAAKDALRRAAREWTDRTGNHDETESAGDKLAGRAAEVLDLLHKIGY